MVFIPSFGQDLYSKKIWLRSWHISDRYVLRVTSILASDHFQITGTAIEVHAASAVFPANMARLAFVGFSDHYERSNWLPRFIFNLYKITPRVA